MGKILLLADEWSAGFFYSFRSSPCHVPRKTITKPYIQRSLSSKGISIPLKISISHSLYTELHPYCFYFFNEIVIQFHHRFVSCVRK